MLAGSLLLHVASRLEAGNFCSASFNMFVRELFRNCVLVRKGSYNTNVSSWLTLISADSKYPQNIRKTIETEYLPWWCFYGPNRFFSSPQTRRPWVRKWLKPMRSYPVMQLNLVIAEPEDSAPPRQNACHCSLTKASSVRLPSSQSSH